MKIKRFWIPSFLSVMIVFLTATPALADMTINTGVIDNWRNNYDYDDQFDVAWQEWNGKSVTVTADFTMPEGPFAKDSWFGLWISDTKQKMRYIMCLYNGSNDEEATRLTYNILDYQKNKGMQRIDSRKSWFVNRKKVTLRIEFTDGKIVFSSAQPGDKFEVKQEITVPETFKPNMIGINTDCLNGKNTIRNLQVNNFIVEGDGPAKSDPLDGTAPVVWNYCNPFWSSLPEADQVFEYPDPLRLLWYIEPDESNVFDLGQDAIFTLRAKTWIYGTNKMKLEYTCKDYWDNTITSGESELGLNRTTEVRTSITVPAGKLPKNGVYKLAIRPIISGKELPGIEQQFAIIPSRKVIPGSFDPTSPYTYNNVGNWKLTARMGVKQIRQDYWNPEKMTAWADKAYQNGLLMNGPYAGIRLNNAEMPGDIDKEGQRIADVFIELNKKYPGMAYSQEIFNEPEALFTSGGREMIGFASLFHRVKENIAKAGSTVKLIGCGPVHCDLDYLKRVAVVGGQNCVDIVAVHGYRSPCRPEFGWDEDVKAIKDLYGQDKPIYVNEDAYFTYVKQATKAQQDGPAINNPFGTVLERDELTQGIYVQRKFLNQLMSGYSAVNQFNAIDNHRLNLTPYYQRSGVVNYAALTWLMKHPKFQKRITPATDHLWMLEWESDGESVYTLWSLNDFHEVSLQCESPMMVYDAFANKIAEGEMVTLNVGGSPIFIKGKNVTLASRKTTRNHPSVVLPEEAPMSETPLAVNIMGHATGMKSAVIDINVKNNSDKAFTGVIAPYFMKTGTYSYVGAKGGVCTDWEFQPKSTEITLNPGEERTVAFVPCSNNAEIPFNPTDPDEKRNYTVLWWAEGYRIAAEIKAVDTNQVYYSQRQMSLRGIPYLKSITVDASGDEWGKIPPFKQLGGKKRNVASAWAWYGEESYNPEFKLAWNEKGLLFYAKVVDDRHDVTQKGLNAWRTDSIQIGLNAKHENPDYTDWPLLTLSQGNQYVYLQQDTVRKKAGEVKEIEYCAKRTEGDYGVKPVTEYECLIPWGIIGDIKGEAGQTFGYSILFNDSDGFWRKGWEGYFQPMGGHIVDPKVFGDLTLIKGE